MVAEEQSPNASKQMSHTTDKYSALGRRGTRLLLMGVGLCALGLMVWGLIHATGLTGRPDATITKIEVPSEIASVIATMEEKAQPPIANLDNSVGGNLVGSVDPFVSISTMAPFIGGAAVLLGVLFMFIQGNFLPALGGLAVGLSTFMMPTMFDMVSLPETKTTALSQRVVIEHAIKTLDYSTLKHLLDTESHSHDPQARYIVAQAAVASNAEQAGSESSDFWDLRKMSAEPVSIDPQRSFALDIAAYGSASHPESHAYLNDVDSKGAVGKVLIYVAILIGLLGLLIGYSGLSIRRRFKRLNQLQDS